MKPSHAAAALFLVLPGCGGAGPGVASASAPGWRTLATEEDRERLASWRTMSVAALAKAAPGHQAAIDDAGATLQPDAALSDAVPPPGDYRCRTFKLGGKAPGDPDFTAGPPESCSIADADGTLAFAQLTGTQRPHGSFYPDGDRRMVFLGTMTLSDETMTMRYGRDHERDMIGAVERVGANRWRIVLPSPRWEAMLEVIDLVPRS